MKIFSGSMLIVLLLLSSAYPQEKQKKFKKFGISLSMGKLFRQFEDMNRIYHRRLSGWDIGYPYWFYAKYEDPYYFESAISYGFSARNRIHLGVTFLQKDIYGSVEVPPYKDYFDRFNLKGIYIGYEITLITFRSVILLSKVSAGYYLSEKTDKYKYYYSEGVKVSDTTIGADLSLALQWKLKWKVVRNFAFKITGGYKYLDFGTYKGNFNGNEAALIGFTEEYYGAYSYMDEHVKKLLIPERYWYIDIDYSGFHADFGVSYFF